MLAAAALEVESRDEDFNDGDDVHLQAAGIQAEIQNDLGIGAADVNFEVISSEDGDRRNDLDKSGEDEAFNDGDDVHLVDIQSKIRDDLGGSGNDSYMDENVVAE